MTGGEFEGNCIQPKRFSTRVSQRDNVRRHLYIGCDLKRVQTIDELRAAAERRLPAFAWQYIESGSEDELTLERNRRVFRNISFVPSTLVDTSGLDSSVELFGARLPAPLVVAPTGFNGLAFPGGDSALARAAQRARIPFTLSSFANESIEEIGTIPGAQNWFQLYILEDPSITTRLVERARQANFKALVVTTDANVSSAREWQRRCYRSPGKLSHPHLIDALCHIRWVRDYVRRMVSHGEPVFANLAEFFPRRQISAAKAASLIASQLKPRITWDDVRKIRQLWDGPLLVKGVMTEADTIRARNTGVDGVVLSNHGGRQLDCAVSPIEVLPAIRNRLPDFPILVDSGFRRGSDVLKALALGANAVMVGRATLYGLAAAGEGGAAHAINILMSEIHRVMGLLGCLDLASVARHIDCPAATIAPEAAISTALVETHLSLMSRALS